MNFKEFRIFMHADLVLKSDLKSRRFRNKFVKTVINMKNTINILIISSKTL